MIQRYIPTLGKVSSISRKRTLRTRTHTSTRMNIEIFLIQNSHPLNIIIIEMNTIDGWRNTLRSRKTTGRWSKQFLHTQTSKRNYVESIVNEVTFTIGLNLKVHLGLLPKSLVITFVISIRTKNTVPSRILGKRKYISVSTTNITNGVIETSAVNDITGSTLNGTSNFSNLSSQFADCGSTGSLRTPSTFLCSGGTGTPWSTGTFTTPRKTKRRHPERILSPEKINFLKKTQDHSAKASGGCAPHYLRCGSPAMDRASRGEVHSGVRERTQSGWRQVLYSDL
nr:MAG: hypothetical protein [Skomarfal virus 29]